jgi:hypothetical protein
MNECIVYGRKLRVNRHYPGNIRILLTQPIIIIIIIIIRVLPRSFKNSSLFALTCKFVRQLAVFLLLVVSKDIDIFGKNTDLFQ